MVISKKIHIVQKKMIIFCFSKNAIFCLSLPQLSVTQEDCAFTRQGSHVMGMCGPQNKFPAPLFFLFGNFS